MVAYFRSKDRKVRIIVAGGELTRLRLAFLLKTSFINTKIKERVYLLAVNKTRWTLRYSVRYRNRCALTTRAGSIFRFFRLSRILIKEMGSRGMLTGIRKSSW